MNAMTTDGERVGQATAPEWVVSKSAGGDRLIYCTSKPSFDLAIVRQDGDAGELDRRAALIAAAPAMLSALEDAARVLDLTAEQLGWWASETGVSDPVVAHAQRRKAKLLRAQAGHIRRLMDRAKGVSPE